MTSEEQYPRLFYDPLHAYTHMIMHVCPHVPVHPLSLSLSLSLTGLPMYEKFYFS